MSYIKKVVLSNFQSHEYTELMFNEGVNTIIGPSDSGKTSIVRAIRWVLYNEPNGDYFIRKGTNEAFAKIIFYNNYEITRGRTKTRNYYIIIAPNGEVTRLEGFGTNIPFEIEEITNIRKFYLDRSLSMELNINHQLDAPFILSESPSFKSNAIGKLAGINRIDDAITGVSSDINKLKTKKNFLIERMDKLNLLLDKYKDLDARVSRMKRLVDLKDILNKKGKKLEKLQFALKRIDEIELSITSSHQTISKFHQIFKIVEITDKLNSMYYERYIRLIRLESWLQNIMKQYADNNQTLVSTASIWLLNDQFKILKEKLFHMNNFISINEKYLHTVNDMQKYSKIIEKTNVELSSDLFNQINLKIVRMKTLVRLFQDISQLTIRINNGIDYLKKYQMIDVLIDKIMNIESLSIQLNKLEKLYSLWSTLSYEEAKINRVREDSNSTLICNLKIYENKIKEHAICPFCNNPIDDRHIQSIIEEYK